MILPPNVNVYQIIYKTKDMNRVDVFSQNWLFVKITWLEGEKRDEMRLSIFQPLGKRVSGLASQVPFTYSLWSMTR